MALEVYSSSKPALAYRGWVAAIALFAMAVGLATGMTWRRTGARFSDMTAPDGWLMAFRVPREFTLADRQTSADLSAYIYRLANRQAFSAELAMWKVSGPHLSATEVCERVLSGNGRSWIGRLLGQSAIRTRQRLGGEEAIEVADPSISMVVRAVVAEDGIGYAISLRVDGVPLDDEYYDLFDISCRSAQFNTR